MQPDVKTPNWKCHFLHVDLPINWDAPNLKTRQVESFSPSSFPSQVAACDAPRSFGAPGVLTRQSLSLLEVIEGLGQPGSVGHDVEVVVQRVYSVAVRDTSPMTLLRARVPSRSSSSPPSAENSKSRYCSSSWWVRSLVTWHPGLGKWVIWHVVQAPLPQYEFISLGTHCLLPAPLLSLRPCSLLFGGTICVSVVRLLFTALQPTKYSHCLQPYGIVWQRTQTFLIESSRSASCSSQFSGKTTWCFQNVVHQQAWVEFVPTCSLWGGTGLSFYDLRFILTLQRKQACAVLCWCENASHSPRYKKQLQSCRMASHLF